MLLTKRLCDHRSDEARGRKTKKTNTDSRLPTLLCNRAATELQQSWYKSTNTDACLLPTGLMKREGATILLVTHQVELLTKPL
jgi:hypothetical protein